jgi:hypothetical protein
MDSPMKKSQIERVSIETMLEEAQVLIITDPDDVTKELAAEAEAVLGYLPLRDKVDPRMTALARVLEKLEIEVLNQEQVDKYKEQVVNDVTAGLRKARRKRATDDRSESEEDADSSSDEYDEELDELSWEMQKLSDYKHPVPAHVLSKAIEIKKAFPRVEFYVDEIIVRRKPDPFLVAKYNKETYYIEVWNEPTFEGRKSIPQRKRK